MWEVSTGIPFFLPFYRTEISGEVVDLCSLSEQFVLSCLIQVEFNNFWLMIEVKYCVLAVSILAKDIWLRVQGLNLFQSKWYETQKLLW